MSEVTKDKAFDRAVDLVIHQDDIAQQWTGRYIAVQTSLAVATAALLSWRGVHLGLVAVIFTSVIGFIAIVLAHALTRIITREYEWQKAYIEMVKRTEGNNPLLYLKPGDYKRFEGKDIPGTFAQIQTWITVAWVLVIFFVIICQIVPSTKWQPNNRAHAVANGHISTLVTVFDP